MLMIRGGHGSFLRDEYPPAIGLSNTGYTADRAVAAADPASWPGWNPVGCATHLLSRKVNEEGPRVQGWAPCRAYTRTLATQVIEGMNAGYDPSPFGFFLSGVWQGVPSWVLAVHAQHMGEYLPNRALTVEAPQDLLDQASTEMLVKLADRKVHLGNALAESKRTVSMIASRTLQVLSAYRALRRGNFRGAAEVLGVNFRKKRLSAANQWLEWQYGWKPLLSDIYGGAELLRKGFRSAPIVRVARKVSRVSDRPVPGLQIPSYEGTCKISVIAIGFYRVDDHFTANLSSLGLINPLEIAWELTPWSFVVDWFIPVSDFLTALTASTGMTFVDGCFSMQARSDFAVTPDYGKNYRVPVKEDLIIFNKAFGFRRIPFGSPPQAHLYMKSIFSENRFYNAIALIEQLRGRRH